MWRDICQAGDLCAVAGCMAPMLRRGCNQLDDGPRILSGERMFQLSSYAERFEAAAHQVSLNPATPDAHPHRLSGTPPRT